MPDRYINSSVFSEIFFDNEKMEFLQFGNSSVLVLIWNLSLLLIPFLLVLFLRRYFSNRPIFGKRKKDSVILAIGIFAWLAFIPNSAYIVTQIRHLLGYCPLGSLRDVCVQNAWMIMFYFIYSIIGWVSFVLLLRQMKRFLSGVLNKKIANVFILSIIPLISLGVLLGLINRFNSWELFTEPLTIMNVMLIYFTDFIYLINWLTFTFGLYILYFAGVVLFKERIKLKK
jgi:uncharacterized membrane protein